MNELILYENTEPAEIIVNKPKVHVDFNVIELPLFSKNKKAKPNIGASYIISKKKNITVDIIPVAGMSIPTDFDRKVYFALVQIALEFKFRNQFNEVPNTIYTTFYEIFSKLNVTWKGGSKKLSHTDGYAEGGTIKRIYESLSKLSGTKYKLRNCFYDAKKSGIESDLYESTFIHSIRIVKMETAIKENHDSVKYIDSRSKEVITLVLNPFFLDNLLHKKGHLKHNFNELIKLEDSVAFSIYWHCDKNRKWLGEKDYGTDRKMAITAKRLAAIIPLAFQIKNVSFAVKRIKEAFEYLKENKYVSNYIEYREKPLENTWYEVFFDWSRYDDEYISTGRESFSIEESKELEVSPLEQVSVEEMREIDFANNIVRKIQRQDTIEIDPSELVMDPGIQDFVRPINSKISSKTKILLNKYFIKNGYIYIKASIEYANQNAKKNYDKYLQDTLINGWSIGKIDELKKQEEAVKRKEIATKQQEKSLEEKRKELENQITKTKEQYLSLSEEMRMEIQTKLVEKVTTNCPSHLRKLLIDLEEYTIAYYALKNSLIYKSTLCLNLQHVMKVV